MNMRIVQGIALSLVAAPLALALSAQAPAPAAERYWPQWRGPLANGISRLATPPLEWGEGKNVRWKVEIPGRGSASPVIWGDRVFILTAIPAGTGVKFTWPARRHRPRGVHRRRDGARSTRWPRCLGAHRARGSAARSVTPGQRHMGVGFGGHRRAARHRVVRIARHLRVRHERHARLGEGPRRQVDAERVRRGSARLYNRLIVVWITRRACLSRSSTRTPAGALARQPHEIDTWATPYVVENAGRAQVIVPGMNRLHSYDLETGEVVWHSEGLTMNPIPSPVGEDGIVIATSGFRGNNLKAIRIADAKGDLTGSKALLWSLDRDTPYVPSPLLYDGFLYLLKSNSPILSVFDAKTGKPHYQLQRLDGLGSEIFSSPVGAAGRVYITGRDGHTLVIRNGGAFEILAKNVLDDGVDASPALVDNEMHMRGYRFLYSLGVK
jgi:hypothetical protein